MLQAVIGLVSMTDWEEPVDTWQALDEERSALADDLATLDGTQWETQSLCEAWKVRHVVGHLIFGADMKAGPVFMGLIKSGMSFNRYVAREGLAIGASPPDSLLEQFRMTIGMRQIMSGAKPEILLVDLVCHSADIRRPTGLRRSVPEVTLLTVANTMKGVGFPIKTKKRIAGLRMTATDFDWSTGGGSTVEGPLASLILAMVGRRAVLNDLSGDGLPAFRSRM
jgi:uncharacterized protein (TIGR03083 family)